MKLLGLLVLTCLALPPSWCAPFREEDHDVKDKMELPEGVHNHSDPYRGAKVFHNNEFMLGDIDVSGQVEGEDISIGSIVEIDVDASNSEDLENPGQVEEDEVSIGSQADIRLPTEEKSSELSGENMEDPIVTDYGHPCPDLTDSPVFMPKGPQGPAGATLHYDLLSNSQADLNYPDGEHLGAFVAATMDSPPNEEKQIYVPRAAFQDPGTNEITITAEKYEENGSPKITSASLSTKGVWTTAQSPEIKNRGYLEIRALMPANSKDGNFSGSFPSIRLLGADGKEWPDCGEIEVAKLRNGEPTVYMALHSANNHGVNGQHPPNSPVHLETDMTKIPVIFGLEWHIKADDGQIDLNWYFKYFDFPSEEWYLKTSTKTLLKSNGEADDFPFFSKSLSEEGFYLMINLAQGGHFTEVNQEYDLLVEGSQRIVIESAKVYRLPDEAVDIQAWNYGMKAGSSCEMYEHCNYGGRSRSFKSGGASYSLWRRGFNDVLSSFRVKPGCKLEIWEHDNYRGMGAYSLQNMQCLAKSSSPWGRRWNDFTSSVRCTCSGSEEIPIKYLSLMTKKLYLGPRSVTINTATAAQMTSTFSSKVITENKRSGTSKFEVGGFLKCFNIGYGTSKSFSKMRRTEDFQKSTIARQWREEITTTYSIPSGKIYICAREMAMYIFRNSEGRKKRMILPTDNKLCGAFGRDHLKGWNLDKSFDVLIRTTNWGLQTKTLYQMENSINSQALPLVL